MSRRKKSFPFFLWHRRIGLAALILVIILSITGIMLNHTEGLGLDESNIESDLLLDWYGINPQGEAINFRQQNTSVSQWQQQLFFNQQNIYSHSEKLVGFAQINDVIAIALQNRILLIDDTGEIIELMSNVTESEILQIGLSGERIALRDSQQFYLSDQQLSRWQATTAQNTEWSQLSSLSEADKSTLKKAFRGQGLTLERVILDLHSGRLLHPTWGVIIMDASAIIMMLLGFSGFWIWWSRKSKQRTRKHYKKHH